MMTFWHTPLLVLSFLAWLHSPPATLADAAAREALRRQMMPPAVRTLTNDDVSSVPKRALPVVAPDEPAASAAEGARPAASSEKPGEAHDESWWRSRMQDLRAALERDQLLADALQSRINALTTEWSARDDPAQRQELFDLRTKALAELDRLKDQMDADAKAIAALEETARRENVPAGWIR